MENPDNPNYLNNIATLEDAKLEISRLLEFQKSSYSFLGLFCNYSIKEPLLALKGYTELLHNKDLAEQHPKFLAIMTHQEEKIHRTIDLVRDLAYIIRDGQERAESVKTHLPPEPIDLNALLSESISLIDRNLQYQNQVHSYSSELSIEKTQPWVFSEVRVSLGDSLSISSCNPIILKEILSDLAWFTTTEGDSTIISFVDVITTFEQLSAKIVFRCSLRDPHRYTSALSDFQRFETSTTFLDFFNHISLSLYKCWHKLKIYNGELFFSVQDNYIVK